MKTVVARLEEQAAQIQKVSAHLDLNKTASQIVLTNQQKKSGQNPLRVKYWEIIADNRFIEALGASRYKTYRIYTRSLTYRRISGALAPEKVTYPEGLQEINRGGCDFPKCHHNERLFRPAQNNASNKDPDIYVAPPADQTDDSIEKAGFDQQSLSCSVNAQFANAIERLRHDEQRQIEKSIRQLARDIEVISQCRRPDHLEE